MEPLAPAAAPIIDLSQFMSPTVITILAIVGALMPILALISDFVNTRIKTMTAAGEPVSPVLKTLGVVLNFLTAAIGKALRQIKGTDQPVATTATATGLLVWAPGEEEQVEAGTHPKWARVGGKLMSRDLITVQGLTPDAPSPKV